MKIAYRKSFSKNGTCYNQSIRVNYSDLQKILEAIKEEKENRYNNYNKYCPNGVCYADMFLTPIYDCEKEYYKNYVVFYLNLTTTNFIKYVFKNKRILNRNTILIYDYKLDK